MGDEHAGLAAGPQFPFRLWPAGRASLAFLADIFALARDDGNIVNPMILAAVIDANVAPINQDPELQRRYAGLDNPPPDELRRPVSISAIAASLSLPYETVRRRLKALSGLGACVITPRGVVVPSAMLDGPQFRHVAIARYDRLKQLYFQLKALGVLQAGFTAPAGVPPMTEPPVRIVNRLISEYVLRVIDALMRRVGDPLTSIILVEMARANAENLSPEQMAFDGPAPDKVRSPVHMLALAQRLGLPAETVRRHVRRLEAMGLCRKAPGGRLAALDQLARPGGGHGLVDNLQNMQRMFSRLAALGILAYWDAEAAA